MMFQKFHRTGLSCCKRQYTIIILVFFMLFQIFLSACGGSSNQTTTSMIASSQSSTTGKSQTSSTSPGQSGTTGKTTVPTSAVTTRDVRPTGSSAGLTSIEAAQLVYPAAKRNFGDAVLFRMAPIDTRDATSLKLAGDWQETDRAVNWFIWYADADGENWMMFSITGSKLSKTDIGTRSFSVMSMGADWPREKPAVSMKSAAKAAVAQGANMNALTWVELACNYAASDNRQTPVWVFNCSETTTSGLTLNYRLLVSAITGQVLGAMNDLNEKLTLPINLANMEKPRTENHLADLRTFIDLVNKKDWTFSMAQLSYNMAPNDTMRQMWLANFQSLDSVEVVSAEPANQVNWTNAREIYKVVLKIKTSQPFEKYGWENGANTRWVTIVPQGAGRWKIEALNSSP